MAYADWNDVIARFDERKIGQLLSDDNVAIPLDEFVTNTKLLAALAGASGEIRAGLLRGQRYSDADLAALTGDDLEYLKDITCIGMFVRLYRRKPYQDTDQHKEILDQFNKALAALRNGEEVFGTVTANLEAGRPLVNTVTRVQARQWDMVVDKCRTRFFPQRRSYRNR